MKATGIVRRIDDLGRVVIPKEIRRTLRIREGDPLEIYVDEDGEVILKKYSPIGELGNFVKEYAEALYESVHQSVLIADRDQIIATAGVSKKMYMEKKIGPLIEQSMNERRVIKEVNKMHVELFQGEREEISSLIIAPIIASGDPLGAVIIMSKDDMDKLGETEVKLAETAASFLAKQMEQ